MKKLSKIKLVKLASRTVIGVVRPVSHIPDKRRKAQQRWERRELRDYATA